MVVILFTAIVGTVGLIDGLTLALIGFVVGERIDSTNISAVVAKMIRNNFFI